MVDRPGSFTGRLRASEASLAGLMYWRDTSRQYAAGVRHGSVRVHEDGQERQCRSRRFLRGLRVPGTHTGERSPERGYRTDMILGHIQPDRDLMPQSVMLALLLAMAQVAVL